MKSLLRRKKTSFFYTEDEVGFDAEMIVQIKMIKEFIIIFFSLPDIDFCQMITIGIIAPKLNVKPKRRPSAVNRHFTDL